jgi:hypothetical protein
LRRRKAALIPILDYSIDVSPGLLLILPDSRAEVHPTFEHYRDNACPKVQATIGTRKTCLLARLRAGSDQILLPGQYRLGYLIHLSAGKASRA